MSLNISALKSKLNELSNKTAAGDVLFKPQEGNNLVRIVPLASNPENPFIEVYFHYLGGKSYLSPLTFGEPDPIDEFCNHLRAGGNLSKEEWNETKKFDPKLRTFAPVIVRGKEAEGVRFWGFGKTTYQELLSVIQDPEYGDITDPYKGRDVKIEFTPGEKSDTKFPKSKIRVSPRETPITTDKELMEKILTIQPNIFEVYKKLSYKELKEVLDKYVSPSSTPAADAAAAVGDDWGTPKVTSAPKTSSSKKQIDDEFESIFNKND